MSRTGVTKIHNSKRRQMYKDDEDDDGVRESTMLSRRRRKRKKVRTEVTTLRPRSSKNKPHLMSNCVRKRMGRYTTIDDLKVTVISSQNYGIFFAISSSIIIITLVNLLRLGGRRRNASV